MSWQSLTALAGFRFGVLRVPFKAHHGVAPSVSQSCKPSASVRAVVFNEGSFAPRGCLAMAGGILGCHSW